MKLPELIQALSLEPLALPDPDRVIAGGYACDLLSWVMGRAQADDVWVTMMTNINVLAVASLADVSCVLLSENVEVEETFLRTAAEKSVNVLRSPLSTFSLCGKLAALLS